MSYQNIGEISANDIVVGNRKMRTVLDAAGVASGQAFLQSELAVRDPLLRKPLMSVTYPRDIPVNVGGGWAEYETAMSVGYGLSGGAGASPVLAGGSNTVPVIQANFEQAVYKAHTFAVSLRVMFVDSYRMNFIGRSIDTALRDGVRAAYDKHMDQNVYVGIQGIGTTGLINNPDVTRASATTGSWATATPDQILADINEAIVATWDACGNDQDAMPNHIIMPYEQWSLLWSTPRSTTADKSVMDYLLENNIAAKSGGDLKIYGVPYCKGAGTGGTDRMVVYVNKERFVRVSELEPLKMTFTQPNVQFSCFDTGYLANLTETQIAYPSAIRYVDGI